MRVRRTCWGRARTTPNRRRARRATPSKSAWFPRRRRRDWEGVVEPGAILIGDGYYGLARGIAVRPDSRRGGTANQVRVGGMSDYHVILVADKDIPLAVDALLGVVVGEGRLQAQRVVEVQGLPHEGLGVCGSVGLPWPAFIPACAEDEPVVPHDPGVLRLRGAGDGVGESIVEPGAILIGDGYYGLARGIAVRPDSRRGGTANQVRVAA